MLLVIDVGNTNTVMGVFDDQRVVCDWRIRTERETTEDEFFVLASQLFAGKDIKPEIITATIVSCVVPPMRKILHAFCKKYLGHEPIWVSAEMDMGMPILYDNPAEVGADRIVNAVAAYERYHDALIVIDFGTATTFDCISKDGEYLGGAISPGVGIASEALFARASKLPRVEIFNPPAQAIGKDTAKSMQSGIILGYAGLVDGLVRRIVKEMENKPRVIATGGLAPLMANVAETIEEVESGLTLEGLRIIFDRVSNS
ncbi:putative transcriptional acitvator, Baf family [Desulfatibacillum aliphaticivorans]|uniref:Type III pantothenate kinase n=1 Tax=Desulfatibacillum aliphaticivorans TaxID=218208 RepID=COAX_DESAL|nr:type III pantothenate kinase [Desulfatibacillum aliphaticivorans]B8FMB1.1 RecName: Full=Type III pantothenate kinase; AltName: Full=PanK-III; AltName: Full=Pantothenic acid kinase [Desulfatibacillum aliphaticivorans]ACL05949.1 putative transcriptional acitvator, Baf family [Desulfatibacillum aliphaticivorans]